MESTTYYDVLQIAGDQSSMRAPGLAHRWHKNPLFLSKIIELDFF